VAYLRFASVYRSFESLGDFEQEIAALRAVRPEPGRQPGRRRPAWPANAGAPSAGAGTRQPAEEADNRDRPSTGRERNQSETAAGGGRSEPEGEIGMAGDDTAGGGNPAAQVRTHAPAATGLRVERVWTTPGVHPYDEVTWQRRDVVMTNWRDGSINFEQRGVEFPDFWSINASNIVTTKYFRGAVGTPQREWSLKQLIDRVVDTYRAAGEQHGYFASPADAEVFAHELTYLLLHQHFSFNSPVWFNVGTASPQQVSACLTVRLAGEHPGRPGADRPAGGVRRGRHQGLRRARRHPDRGDQGQRGPGGHPPAHHRRLHP
jgi:hypothetical protein